jgi:antitoxin VapB
MNRNGNEELEIKLEKTRALLSEHDLDGLLLRRTANFSWLTGGACSWVNVAEETGLAALLVTAKERYLITNNIEAPRLRQEAHLEQMGWQFVVSPWYDPGDPIAPLVHGLRLATDGLYPGTDISPQLSRLRMDLLPPEQERLRVLAKDCAQAMDAAIRQVHPGLNEFAIAGCLAKETQERGITPLVNLIATDERIFSFRHPVPTAKELERYAMLVLSAARWGLVCSLTRLVYFGRLPDELRRKALATATIDATFIHETRPGNSVNQIFQRAQEQYARAGFADEWQLHHQGGLCGYLSREVIVTPSSELTVAAGQAYAWNPSITGTKSEDTFLVGPEGNEILTAIEGWPMLQIEVDGQSIARPAILELA